MRLISRAKRLPLRAAKGGICFCIPALFLASCASVSRIKGGDPDAANTVRRVESTRFDAMVRNDLVLLAQLLTDDLTYVHSNGDIESKSALLATLRERRLVYDSIIPSDVAVRIEGTSAIVTGRARLYIRSDGEIRPLTVRFTDVYVQRAGRWRTVVWQSTVIPNEGR